MGRRCTMHVGWCVMYFWFTPRSFLCIEFNVLLHPLWFTEIVQVTSVAPRSGRFVIPVSHLADSLSSDTVDGRIACMATCRKAGHSVRQEIPNVVLFAGLLAI